MMKHTNEIINILLVEDNESDILLTTQAFKSSQFKNKVYSVCDGVDALSFLRKEAAYTDVPRPDIILLDLNMPRMDGSEVLAEIKNDPNFKTIPTIILTTSAAASDLKKSYQNHANCYIVKPFGFSEFSKVAKKVEDFWFDAVMFPPRELT
jgi:CheY-like chemotaxis protein